MKKLVIMLIALFSFISVDAEEIDAIYAWVNGSSTCYKLESMPKVTFSGSTAVLTLKGQDTPILTLEVEKSSDLRITFGVYKESAGIDQAQTSESPVTKSGKYIIGGKLVIIKDGKKYNSNGIEIK